MWGCDPGHPLLPAYLALTLALALGPFKWDRSRLGSSSSGAFSFVVHSPTHTSASGCAAKLACTFIQLCAGPQRPPPSQPACALWPYSWPCRKSAGDKPQQATGSAAETTQVRNSAGALQGDGALHAAQGGGEIASIGDSEEGAQAAGVQEASCKQRGE